MRDGFVYIMASVTRTLYIGVSHSLVVRAWQHQRAEIPGFTRRYKVHRLVYFEHYEDIRDVIAREKQLKGWRRCRKNELIEQMNPAWKDLSDMLEQHPRIIGAGAASPKRSQSRHNKDAQAPSAPDASTSSA
jgi:putative endonuclease